MTRKALVSASLIALVMLCGACRSTSGSSAAPAAVDHRAAWAKPVDIAGVPNLHQLNEHLYRSAQPSAEGFKNLEKQLGLRSVICLRQFHNNIVEAQDTLLRMYYVPFSPWSATEDDVIRALRIIARQQDGPFLVHCLHGADRTGLICAAYRVVFDHWTPEEACDEMVEGGFGFHPLWANIPELLLKMDFDKIRRQVLSPEASPER
ncbi:MAG: tyrosine-protein phosphatase [Lentisphaeria bacterium]|jgi:protein tyrosine phosphatase (PTP) superfamily phosphohydrolase (DUF442 family)